MNIWKDINPKRISPEEFVAVVEISKGSKKKYEMDKETGMLILDRILYTSTHYPANYGFIPLTYAEDNDPLDVLILCSESRAPMSLVRCRPIGMLTMIDSGSRDEKIIAVAINDPNYSGYTSLEELPRHLFDEMEHFFTVYKQLEGKSTAVNSLDSRETAEQTIATCMEEFKRHIK